MSGRGIPTIPLGTLMCETVAAVAPVTEGDLRTVTPAGLHILQAASIVLNRATLISSAELPFRLPVGATSVAPILVVRVPEVDCPRLQGTGVGQGCSSPRKG
jgi:hypothetical protein